MNTIQQLEQEQIAALAESKGEMDFAPGDTVRVDVKVVEGTRERIQAFEGVCIARKSRGINSSFTVRKISFGEGVERVFPLYSPRIDAIHVVRRGDVRRAKLYYLRGRTGKSARIAEKTTGAAGKILQAERQATQSARREQRRAAKAAKAAGKQDGGKQGAGEESKE